MNIFPNLPSEFVGKIVLFSFWYNKNYILHLWFFLYQMKIWLQNMLFLIKLVQKLNETTLKGLSCAMRGAATSITNNN